jgi:hypothetical protein
VNAGNTRLTDGAREALKVEEHRERSMGLYKQASNQQAPEELMKLSDWKFS